MEGRSNPSARGLGSGLSLLLSPLVGGQPGVLNQVHLLPGL